MTPVQIILWLCVALLVAVVMALVWQVRSRNMHRWLWTFLRQEIKRWWASNPSQQAGPTHVLLCIADHFEPAWGDAPDAVADERVEAWLREYPLALGSFRDSDGRPPRHTFFYPIDQYEPRHVDALASLCGRGFGEVEIHLHHDRDTAENLERTLLRFSKLFAERHGVLGRWDDGRVSYGFVHGNWALDNSRPDGRWCGVNNEIDVLRRTGCYADFTLPSAPDVSQTSTINSIYYAVGKPGCCKSHDAGTVVGTSPPPENGLLMIQGPLRLWWPAKARKPRIENGCLQRGQPPSMERLDQWIKAGVRVEGRPDWVFVKLHTHGAKEQNRNVLLGKAAIEFHGALAQRMARDPNFCVHYVTAREMFNLIKAAEAGWTGSVIGGMNLGMGPRSPHNAPESLVQA